MKNKKDIISKILSFIIRSFISPSIQKTAARYIHNVISDRPGTRSHRLIEETFYIKADSFKIKKITQEIERFIHGLKEIDVREYCICSLVRPNYIRVIAFTNIKDEVGYHKLKQRVVLAICTIISKYLKNI